MSDSQQFKCVECGNQYKFNKHLREHVSKAHGPEKLSVLAPLRRNNHLNVHLCSDCGKQYKFSKHLREHVSKYHPENLVSLKSPKESDLSYVYQCADCDQNFNSVKNLRNHRGQYHAEGVKKVKCVCRFEASSETCYINHLEAMHSVEVQKENLQFSCMSDFEDWKVNIEKRTNSMFIRNHGAVMSAVGNKKIYYNCHRSGYFVSKSRGVREVKLQGSNKIGGVCPAKIKVTQTSEGQLEVIFISTHFGHENDLSHIKLTQTERAKIATDIANKIPYHEILDKIRDSVCGSKLERVHLLTRQDLANIERSFSLCSSEKHKNDAISVEAWVHEMTSGENRCVLFYKPQGTLTENHSNLASSDFVLIIMNDAQSELLKKYGYDCVCMDGTHGMNAYDFELTTLLILDDMRQGFPCAFLISNRSDTLVISIFLHYIKSVVGIISPKVFMSDLADTFYNAWSTIMGPPVKRLFCTWHLDKAWRKNICKKISDLKKQAQTYKFLRVLLEERDVSTFQVMLPAVLEELKSDPDTFEFSKYIQENYAHNTQCWAYCHRLHAGLNTNMHLERMHRTIKCVYLKGKTVKRLDKAIFSLMQFVKDKLFDRLIVITKGKLTDKLKHIRHRHKSSFDLDKSLITKEEGGWRVPSSSDRKEIYFVQENEVDCTCKLRCEPCKTCIHRYTCSCVDSSIKWQMCKHVHTICQIQLGMQLPTVNSDLDRALLMPNVGPPVVNERDVLLAQVSSGEPLDDQISISHEKNVIASQLSEILASISTRRELGVLKKHVASLQATLSAVQNGIQSEFVPTSEGNCKRKIVPQRMLFSTKKKRTHHKTLEIPNSCERQEISLSLVQNRDIALPQVENVARESDMEIVDLTTDG